MAQRKEFLVADQAQEGALHEVGQFVIYKLPEDVFSPNPWLVILWGGDYSHPWDGTSHGSYEAALDFIKGPCPKVKTKHFDWKYRPMVRARRKATR